MNRLDVNIWLEFAGRILSDDTCTRQGKDVQLAGLLSQMEVIYNIPLLQNARFERWALQNPDVLAAYRQIGEMRAL